MKINEEDFLVLLRQKKELIFDIFCVTKDTVFRGNDLEEDAEKYIDLMEMRNELVENLKSLDVEMNLPECIALLEEGGPSFQEQAAVLRREIQEIAGKIIGLDREMNRKLPEIRAHFQKEVKDLNQSKNMRSVYERDHIFNEGYYVDKKN